MTDHLNENIYTIEGVSYIPVPKIGNFGPYSYSRIRGLIHEKKIPQEKLMRICNLTFIRMDYLKTLRMMSEDPEKFKKQKFQIDQYYKGKISEEIVDQSKLAIR